MQEITTQSHCLPSACKFIDHWDIKIALSLPPQPALLDPEELLVRFLKRMQLWLEENHARIINLFRKLDSDNDNVLSKEDFFIGMRMMDVSMIIS